jgi:anthranilate synthase component 1
MFYKRLTLDLITPVAIYTKVKEYYSNLNEPTFLFESSVNSSDGNFSFITIGARQKVYTKNSESFFVDEDKSVKQIDSNPFNFLKDYYKQINFDKYKEYTSDLKIPFVDGFIGFIGYDMVKEFEPVLKKDMDNLYDNINTTDLELIRPKITIAYSHKSSTLTIVSFLEEYQKEFDNIENILKSPTSDIAIKKFQTNDEGNLYISKDKFFDLVEKSKEKIVDGDIFQILITNRFTLNAKVDRLSFYRTLRSKNPSPYLFLLEFDEFAIAGSSPEVMVRLTDNQILLRPIAGTRKRGKNAKRDKELEKELMSDKKELAEHLMLVDLGRNDVGRVAKSGTVNVSELMRVEKYSHVMHIVSDVEATLDEKYDMFDLFMATFTAGTMTGAPKIKAMQLIAQFEQLKRGFYSGSIGYFGFDGNMDSAITIRTALLQENQVTLQAGAGIVADSVNELEYLEITNKMKALLSSLEDLRQK